MYDHSIPGFRQILNAMVGVLDKAAAHCEAKKINPEALIKARLFPDMFAFNQQVLAVIFQAEGFVAKMRGGAYARPTMFPETFEGLRASVAAALATLDGVKPAELAGKESVEVTFEIPGGALRFNGLGYLTGFVLPNAYFHAATAYGILRHNGVELGKRDYLGKLPLIG